MYTHCSANQNNVLKKHVGLGIDLRGAHTRWRRALMYLGQRSRAALQSSTTLLYWFNLRWHAPRFDSSCALYRAAHGHRVRASVYFSCAWDTLPRLKSMFASCLVFSIVRTRESRLLISWPLWPSITADSSSFRASVLSPTHVSTSDRK